MRLLASAALVLALAGVLTGTAAPATQAPQLSCKYGVKYVVKVVRGHRKRVKVCKPKPKPKPKADLELTMTTSSRTDQVTAGNHVAYTFTVENKGPAYADGVTVQADVPAGEADVSAYDGAEQNPQCESTTSDSGTTHLECSFGLLSTEDPYAFVQVILEPSAAGDATIQAKVSAGTATADPHPENNQASRVLHVLPGPASADLSLAVTAGPGATVPDGYDETISVTNHGPTDATDVYVTLLLPQGASVALIPSIFDLALAPGIPTGLCPPYVYSVLATSIACFDSISAGETQSKTIRVLPSIRSPSTVQTDAVVSAYTRDPSLANNRASSTAALAPFTPKSGPDIRLALEPRPDLKAGKIAFPFRLENLGLGDLDGVSITASVSPALANPTMDLFTVSSGTQCSSTDGSIGCLFQSIESDSRQLGAVVGTAAPGTYSVTVTVTAANLSAPVSDTATFEVKPSPALR